MSLNHSSRPSGLPTLTAACIVGLIVASCKDSAQNALNVLQVTFHKNIEAKTETYLAQVASDYLIMEKAWRKDYDTTHIVDRTKILHEIENFKRETGLNDLVAQGKIMISDTVIEVLHDHCFILVDITDRKSGQVRSLKAWLIVVK